MRIRQGFGSSIFADTGDYIALDIKTTGLDSDVDDIFEIGAIKVKDGKPVKYYEQLVNPEDLYRSQKRTEPESATKTWRMPRR
jgi:DNA polymerase III alpha subunit (gram-positive type)